MPECHVSNLLLLSVQQLQLSVPLDHNYNVKHILESTKAYSVTLLASGLILQPCIPITQYRVDCTN